MGCQVLDMTTSRTKVLVILLLLFVAVMPIVQLGIVSGERGGGGGVGGGGGAPRPSPQPRPSPPPRPNPPVNVNPPQINQPTVRPPINQPTFNQPTINLPTAKPTFNPPTINIPTINQPTAQPTFSVGVSFTQSFATSFSFDRSSWTGISITRTVATSYTFSPTFTYMTTTDWYAPGGYWYPGMGFLYYGTNYNPSTGSFYLGRTLYDQNNNPCLYYDYFEFNAPAGLSISAQLWSSGQPIHYILVPVSVISQYKSPSSCSALGMSIGQVQSFSSTPYVLNWTSPQNGQYAIIFFSTTPYNDPVYFLPQ